MLNNEHFFLSFSVCWIILFVFYLHGFIIKLKHCLVFTFPFKLIAYDINEMKRDRKGEIKENEESLEKKKNRV